MLYLVVPMFAGSDKEENSRREKWDKWFYSPETTERFIEFGIDPDNENQLGVTTPGVGYKWGEDIKRTYTKIVPKGRVIRDRFTSIIYNPNNFFICIDGDGQLNFNYIFNVLEGLKSGSEYVTACREFDYGIGPDRQMIEEMELSIISKIFNVRLPDGQCGCWGINTNIIPEIGGPVAQKFEIELDILISCLNKGYMPTYFPIEVKSSRSSTFASDHHIDKLNLIKRKMYSNPEDLLKTLIRLSYHEFDFESKTNYPEILDLFGVDLRKEKIPNCFGSCEKCRIR